MRESATVTPSMPLLHKSAVLGTASPETLPTNDSRRRNRHRAKERWIGPCLYLKLYKPKEYRWESAARSPYSPPIITHRDHCCFVGTMAAMVT